MSNQKQTPQQKWDAKAGYICKSFKMYKSLADDFKAACEKKGVSQAAQISKLMQGFIDEVNNQ